MAADPNISSLQKAINRFTTVAVPSVVIDGILGPKTADALIKALGFIASQLGDARETATTLITKLITDQGAYNYAQITASAPGLTIYLNDRADDAALPKAGILPTAAPIVPTSKPIVQTTKPTTAPDLVLQLKRPTVAASLSDLFTRMPKWASYAGGALLALGALAVVISTSRKRRALPDKSRERAALTGWSIYQGLKNWR